MQKKLLILFSFVWASAIGLILFNSHESKAPAKKSYSVALLVMATGKYVEFVPRLLKSADQYFLPGHQVGYFVFTDGKVAGNFPNLKTIHQEQLGWPYDTMMRFQTYLNNKDAFAAYDYVYACDADMIFADTVGDEILADLVGTLQPNYLFDPKPYETNALSTACINRGEGKHYFAGAFYGGKRETVLKLLETTSTNISIDLARGLIATVHDESHLNRYFINNQPSLVLNPSYCHFESWDSPYPKKLVAFDKLDHEKALKRKMKTFSPLAYFKKLLTTVT
jgi:histo-blood group ABO system transferase